MFVCLPVLRHHLSIQNLILLLETSSKLKFGATRISQAATTHSSFLRLVAPSRWNCLSLCDFALIFIVLVLFVALFLSPTILLTKLSKCVL